MAKDDHTLANEKIREALDLLKEASNHKKVELLQMVKDLYQQVQVAEGKVVEKAKDVASDVDEHVHKNPWRYVGAAAVGGLILGVLMTFRRSGR